MEQAKETPSLMDHVICMHFDLNGEEEGRENGAVVGYCNRTNVTVLLY